MNWREGMFVYVYFFGFRFVHRAKREETST
jgi:hypothetical protein